MQSRTLAVHVSKTIVIYITFLHDVARQIYWNRPMFYGAIPKNINGLAFWDLVYKRETLEPSETVR